MTHARVLYEDAHWLCIDKPSGVFTTPSVGNRAPSLVGLVRSLRPRASYHHPLSRLDTEVTGVVLFALTAKALACAERARAEGRYERSYVGLLAAAPTPPQGLWTWPVAIDRRAPRKRTVGSGDAPKPAETRYAIEAHSGPLVCVGFVPVTGRTHQIRVHAHAAGTPLVGDVAYGGLRRLVLEDGTVLSIGRVMLHARWVRIPGGDRVVEAPWHDDMRTLWERCKTADAPGAQ
jgi:23S rRNA-/tRNA-specific pseudouridylate synthase